MSKAHSVISIAGTPTVSEATNGRGKPIPMSVALKGSARLNFDAAAQPSTSARHNVASEASTLSDQTAWESRCQTAQKLVIRRSLSSRMRGCRREIGEQRPVRRLACWSKRQSASVSVFATAVLRDGVAVLITSTNDGSGIVALRIPLHGRPTRTVLLNGKHCDQNEDIIDEPIPHIDQRGHLTVV